MLIDFFFSLETCEARERACQLHTYTGVPSKQQLRYTVQGSAAADLSALLQGGLAELLAGGPNGHRDSNTQLALLAAYLAAAVHDVNHMGLTNDFLVRT